MPWTTSVIKLPKTKELILLIYANEFSDVILLFSSLKRYRNSNHCKIAIFKLGNVDLQEIIRSSNY